MQVSLDGKTMELAGARTLAELLEGLAPHIDPARTVTAVDVDGRPVDHSDRVTAAAFRLVGSERVCVTTETPAEFAASRRAALGGYLAAIAGRFDAAAARLRGGDVSEGNRLLAAASRDLALVLELDRHLCALDAQAARCDPIVSVLERIGSRLTDAERERRWEEVATLLSAELAPVVRATA